ncbi:hypothetical protein ACT691_04595 [Vibrio metschnikovii]
MIDRTGLILDIFAQSELVLTKGSCRLN